MSKIFGTIFPFVESHDTSLRLGRFVANYEFLKALLNYGTFDEFHLYCLNPAHFQQTVSKLSADTTIDNGAKQKVSLFLFDTLEKNLGEVDYEVFHLGGWGYFYAGAVHLRNNFAKVPFPITGIIHSLNGQETPFHSFKLLKSAHQKYDAIVCTSMAGQQVLEKNFERMHQLDDAPKFIGEYLQIPLAFEDGLTNIPSKEESRKKLNIDLSTTVLLYLGRLSPTTKGDLYPLLLALKRVISSTTKPIQLILAGGVDPNELRLHKEMIAELKLDKIVRLMINFEEKDKNAIYSSADICVAPSDNIQETFGISIIEAMAAGVPVVAADINGYKELVTEGETGFKITTTWIDQFPLSKLDDIMDFSTMQLLLAQAMVIDVPQMSDRILELINNKNLREEMGAKAKEIAYENYGWKTVIEKYEKDWSRLKEIAIKTGVESKGENLFSNNYLSSFSHYPTRVITGKNRVSITERGEQLLVDGVFPALYGNLALVLDQQSMVAILSTLKTGSKLVEKTLSQFNAEQKDKAKSGLLWLAKYDLIRVEL